MSREITPVSAIKASLNEQLRAAWEVAASVPTHYRNAMRRDPKFAEFGVSESYLKSYGDALLEVVKFASAKYYLYSASPIETHSTKWVRNARLAYLANFYVPDPEIKPSWPGLLHPDKRDMQADMHSQMLERLVVPDGELNLTDNIVYAAQIATRQAIIRPGDNT